MGAAYFNARRYDVAITSMRPSIALSPTKQNGWPRVTPSRTSRLIRFPCSWHGGHGHVSLVIAGLFAMTAIIRHHPTRTTFKRN